jgi:hypothetical protein
MGLSNHMLCKDLLLDLICYELRSRRLSPEMKYLLERHLEHCKSCRGRILGFQRMLRESEAVRNYG